MEEIEQVKNEINRLHELKNQRLRQIIFIKKKIKDLENERIEEMLTIENQEIDEIENEKMEKFLEIENQIEELYNNRMENQIEEFKKRNTPDELANLYKDRIESNNQQIEKFLSEQIEKKD